jgi:urease subunit gamma/beta
MNLSPSERDRLLLFTTAELARARRRRGLSLNVVEATALVADTVCEAARDGMRLAEAVDAGRSVLAVDDVLPGVVRAVPEVRVEAVFDDGTRLAVVRDPFRAAETPPPPGSAPDPAGSIGQLTLPSGVNHAIDPVEDPVAVAVTNTSAVTIGVTSHFHFFEANPRLRFDRAVAYGMHLAIPAGEAVVWEAGATRTVGLVPIGGRRVVIGFAGLVDGPLDEPGAKERALERARACGYEGA